MAALQAAPFSLLEALPRVSPSSSSISSISSSSLSSAFTFSPLFHNRLVRRQSYLSTSPSPSLLTRAVTSVPSTGAWNGSPGSPRLAPSWSLLGQEISTGPCPRSPRELKKLVENTGASALVFLETEEGCAKLGLDWNKFRERASEFGTVAIRISMREGDYLDQAAALPEAIRAVSTLLELGYKVHISCYSGIERSPLVALGYMTFIKGLDLKDAVETINEKNPVAKPHFQAWEETKTKMAAGDLKRVSALANEISQRRATAKLAGTPSDDWLTAQQLLIAEAFERGVATEITLSDAMAKVESVKTNRRALEELALHKANAEKAIQLANASKEKIDFYSRQLENLKEKEEILKQQAFNAVKEKESLEREFEILKAKKGLLTQFSEPKFESKFAKNSDLSEGEKKEVTEKIAKESEKLKELMFRMDKMKKEEMRAKKEVQNLNGKLKSVTEKLSIMEKGLTEAKTAKENANLQVKEILNQISQVSSTLKNAKSMADTISELSKKESSASAALSLAKERFDFIQRQFSSLKEKEEITKSQLLPANKNLEKITKDLQIISREESALKDNLSFLKSQISEPSEKPRKIETASVKKQEIAEKDNAEIKKLQEELSNAQKREKKAFENSLSAKDQLEFYERQIQNLREKESKAVQVLEFRMDTFQKEVLAKAQREVEEKTQLLTKAMEEKLKTLSLDSKKVLEEAKSAKEKVDFFHRRLDLMKEREEKTKKTSEERERYFAEQISKLREKLAAANFAVSEADKKILSLSSQILDLEKKELSFAEAAKAEGILGEGEAEKGFTVDAVFKHIEFLKEKETSAKRSLLEANLQIENLYKKVEDLERRESQAFSMANKYREKVAEMTRSTTEMEEELKGARERERELLNALEDGSGILKIAMEADETVQRLKKEAKQMASDLQDVRIRADLLAAQLEIALVQAGKKPKHWNDLDKIAAVNDIERQLVLKMSTMQNSMSASGTAVATSVEETPTSELLKTVLLGTLGVAAVPITIISMLTGNSGNPDVIGAMSASSPQSSGAESAGRSVEAALQGPIIKGTSPEEFCNQVPSGLRSLRTDKFCNTILGVE